MRIKFSRSKSLRVPSYFKNKRLRTSSFKGCVIAHKIFWEINDVFLQRAEENVFKARRMKERTGKVNFSYIAYASDWGAPDSWHMLSIREDLCQFVFVRMRTKDSKRHENNFRDGLAIDVRQLSSVGRNTVLRFMNFFKQL